MQVQISQVGLDYQKHEQTRQYMFKVTLTMIVETLKLSVLCEDETRPHVRTTDYLIN